MSKIALIYHTDLSINASLDDKDVLDEARYVSEGLRCLNYDVIQLPFKFDRKNYKNSVNFIKQQTKETRPDIIFNLVETIDGTDRLSRLAPQVFEKILKDLEIPYTGCPLSAFQKTQTKTLSKRLFIANDIPTPNYVILKNLKQFLVKSNTENASRGIEGRVYSGENFFVEEYIEGREFNVSCMGRLGHCAILPIAEMKFDSWPEDKPKIVSYDAKWNPNSEEYKKTNRSFDFPYSDRELLNQLEDITRKCWDVFDLQVYARIDFRVDKNGNPYVLEINVNPGIAEDSGFVAATRQAGMKWEHVLEKIIQDSCRIVS